MIKLSPIEIWYIVKNSMLTVKTTVDSIVVYTEYKAKMISRIWNVCRQKLRTYEHIVQGGLITGASGCFTETIHSRTSGKKFLSKCRHEKLLQIIFSFLNP